MAYFRVSRVELTAAIKQMHGKCNGHQTPLMGQLETFLKPFNATVEATLARYIPRHVLTSGHHDAPQQREFHGILLMLDIAGFTSLTEAFADEGTVGAERLSAILDHYFGSMTDIAVTHGGDVLDIVGDAVIVVWESPDHVDEAGQLAIQCGLALQAALPQIIAETGAQLRQRVSVAFGELAHFIVGGVDGKWHCLTAGKPLVEAALANHDGGSGDVVVCSSLWQHLEHCCAGQPLPAGGATVSRLDNPVALPANSGGPALSLPIKLDRYVSQPLLERLRMGGGRWLGEYRTVTTLFVGVPSIDCTSDNALPLLQTLIEGAQRVHARVGGTPTRLSSDDKGVFLLSAFGLPQTAREDDAVRAVTAAQTLFQYMREHGIGVAMGITTGPVFYADSGGEERRHAGLTGAAVNLASRLMVAANGAILCDSATQEAAIHGFQFESQEPMMAKGFIKPISVWRPGTRLSRERRAFLGMAVGRAEELSRMTQSLSDVVLGSSAAFVLRGEAGIGKSRLISDMAVRARERGMRVAWGVGYALETASVFYPWRQIFAQMLSENAEFDPGTARTMAAAVIADDLRLTSWLPLLNDVLPLHFQTTEVTRQMTSQARAASLRTLVIEFAIRLSRVRPMLLVADDLHWFDSASASLLLSLAAARVPGLLILAGTRPLDADAAAAVNDVLGEVSLIDLDALSPSEVGALISGRLGALETNPALAEFVAARSGGNPFYAEEIVLALRTSGHLEMSDSVVDFARGNSSQAALPEGLRGIIVSRIDALGAAEQLVLKIAAVVGREFSLQMLKDLLPPTEALLDLAQVARVLEREDVVRPARTPGAGYRFKHALLQETVYEQLPLALRQELHTAVAMWIERNEPDDLEPRYAELAAHWERALNMPSAVSYLALSAALSLRRYANREAIAQASHALMLTQKFKLPADAARDARCEGILGDACNELFEYRAATRHFLLALAHAGRPAPVNQGMLMLDLSWQLVVQLSSLAGLRRRISQDPLLPWASHIHEKLGEIAYFDAGTLPLLHATLTSLNLAERSGTVREAVDGLAALAIGFYGAGQHKLSRVYNRRSLKLAEEKGGIADIAYAHLVNGVYRAAQGLWDQAGQSLNQSVVLYNRLGAVERWQQAYGGLCAIDLIRGRFEHARNWLDKLSPAKRETPVQIAVYFQAFSTSLALATNEPLTELIGHLRKLVASPELAQFDRVLCQGLIAAACWRLNDRPAAVKMALAGLESLAGRIPAAWYVTDGLAGIAQTLIDASVAGLVDIRQARNACRLLNRYGRATPVAGPRAALVSGQLALSEGNTRLALQHWQSGLALATVLGTGYDETLLLQSLGKNQYPKASAG